MFECCDKMRPIETVYGVCYGTSSPMHIKDISNVELVISRKNGSIGKLDVEVSSPNLAMYALSPENTVTYKTDKNILLDSASNTLVKNVHYTIYLAAKVKLALIFFSNQIIILFL